MNASPCHLLRICSGNSDSRFRVAWAWVRIARMYTNSVPNSSRPSSCSRFSHRSAYSRRELSEISPITCDLKISEGKSGKPRAFITLKIRYALLRSGVLTTTSMVLSRNILYRFARSLRVQSNNCSRSALTLSRIARCDSVTARLLLNRTTSSVASRFCTYW